MKGRQGPPADKGEECKNRFKNKQGNSQAPQQKLRRAAQAQVRDNAARREQGQDQSQTNYKPVHKTPVKFLPSPPFAQETLLKFKILNTVYRHDFGLKN